MLRRRVLSAWLKERHCWFKLAGRLPASSHISWETQVWGDDIAVGRDSWLAPYAIVSTCGGNILEPQAGYVRIGDSCRINAYAQIHSWQGSVEIGNHCTVNSNTIIYGTGGVRIGDGVRIAANTTIVASMHNYDSTDIPIFKQGHSAKGITIEDDIWIGAGVVILDGVTVGTGSVVGAGAVVNKDVPPYSIVAGVPARLIRSRR